MQAKMKRDIISAPRLTTLSNVSDLALQDQASCAKKTNGTIWCWGWNGYGGVGDGTTGTNRLLPVQVLNFP